MERKGAGFFRILGKIVVGIVIAALIALIVGALVMMLWNWLMPVIFGFGPITYWQGFGLVLLLRLLIGGFEHAHRDTGGRRHIPPRLRRDGHFDDVYEQWWQCEGEERFRQYMKDRGEKDEPEAQDAR